MLKRMGRMKKRLTMRRISSQTNGDSSPPKRTLPLSLGGISSAPKPKRQLVAVGIDEGSEAEQRLSGSDLLRALQRAAANKSKEKANRNYDNDAAATWRGNEQSSTVKPIRIDPQWPHQLHQLVTRLRQLPRA